MADPTFRITLADLKTLADAMCAVDVLRFPGDKTLARQVSACHDAIVRTLGAQVEMVYAFDDHPEKVSA